MSTTKLAPRPPETEDLAAAIIYCLCGKPHPCARHSLTPVDEQLTLAIR